MFCRLKNIIRAKKKTADQQNSGPVKHEQYIRTRARLLPVYRCFMTDSDFAVTKFILEEDDDNVELIEYEFGHNGKHCLAPRTPSETAKYKPLLDKTLGEGNYEYLLPVSLE